LIADVDGVGITLQGVGEVVTIEAVLGIGVDGLLLFDGVADGHIVGQLTVFDVDPHR
jgi:hypothetical protein